jgi:hypothetical protein
MRQIAAAGSSTRLSDGLPLLDLSMPSPVQPAVCGVEHCQQRATFNRIVHFVLRPGIRMMEIAWTKPVAADV